MSDHEDIIRNALIHDPPYAESDDARALVALDALLAGHAAELDRLRQAIAEDVGRMNEWRLTCESLERELVEARAENERLRHRIDYLLRTDPSEWEPEVIRWLSLAAAQEPPAAHYDRERNEWHPRCPYQDVCTRCDADGFCPHGTQGPPAGGGYDTSIREHPYVRELEERLRLACDGCAECGHIDWRELDDILDGDPVTRYSHLFPPAEGDKD